MTRNRYLILAVFALAAALPTQLFAWGSKVHIKVVSDAYHIMPKAFRAYMGETSVHGTSTVHKPAMSYFTSGAVEPDAVLKDFQNHIFHIQATSMGKAPFHIQELSEELVEDIKAGKSRKQIARKMGWLAHYIADLAQPLHTGSSLDDTIEEKSYHSATERDADKYVLTYGVNFDGCDNVKRISARLIYEALWSNRYYDTLEAAYTKGKRYEDSRPAIVECYSRAVNNVVDIWYTIWARAGGKVLPSDSKKKNYPPMEQYKPAAAESVSLD